MSTKTCLYLALCCIICQMYAVQFGFRTCTSVADDAANSVHTFTVYYQWGNEIYTCSIASPDAYDTLFQCETDTLKPLTCATSDYWLQINAPDGDPDDVAVSAIIVNGQEVQTPCSRIGNHANFGPNPYTSNEARYRFYDLGDSAPASIPDPVSSQVLSTKNSIYNTCLVPGGFGFRTCTAAVDGAAQSADTFTIHYQWGEDLYTCNIAAPNEFDTVYQCDTAGLTPRRCGSDYWLQINAPDGNPDDVAVSAIIVNGQEIQAPCSRVGNNGLDGPNPAPSNDAMHRFYDLGDSASVSIPNPVSSIVGVSKDPIRNPVSSPPTASPTYQNCEDSGDIKHIDWDEMITNGGDELPAIDYNISVSSADMTVSIEVELDYLGYSYISGIYGFGTRYHLGFYSFDKESAIPSCDKKMTAAFVNKTWTESWEYSEYPYLDNHIANKEYPAYPPSDYWTLAMDPNDLCSRIIYSAVFTWQDLRDCQSEGIDINIDANFINMSGIFFVNVISPISMLSNIDYYKYGLLSYPFSISIKKSMILLDDIDIFIFTSSIISVDKDSADENILQIRLLTESSQHVTLSNPAILASPSYDSKDFIYIQNMSECLSTSSHLCSQIWDITVNVECPFTFDGDFGLQFTAQCDDNNDPCLDYISTYGSMVTLSAGLKFDDYICDENVWTIQYNADMIIYEDNTFASSIVTNVVTDERVYVEVAVDDFNVDNTGYSVLDVKLLNAWLCTSNDTLSLGDGCFSSNVDPDGPYHIIVNYDESFRNGAQHEDETYNDIARFSFIIPSTITRNSLYIQAQISLEFSRATPSRRRVLLGSNDVATQMIYGSRSISFTRSEVQNVNSNDTGNNDRDGNNGYIYIIIAAIMLLIIIILSSILIHKCRSKSNYNGVMRVDSHIDHNHIEDCNDGDNETVNVDLKESCN